MKTRKLLAAASLALCSALTVHAAEPLDRILVVVNDGLILQSELTKSLADAKRQIAARGIAVPDDSVLRSQVLDRLILVRLQTHRAQQAGIRIDDRELNDILTGIARQNGMTLAQFADTLRREGEDFLSVREQVREEVMISRIRNREVDARVTVSEADLDQALASQGPNANVQYRLSHILVAVPDGANDDQRAAARAKAEILRGRIRNGEDFAQVAIASSDGQQALQGGDLDWRNAADLPLLFSNAAAKLADGGVTDVLEASSGFHILKLTGKRGDEVQTVQETRARHILIMPNAIRDEEQARVQAVELHKRLLKGEKFEELAQKNSDDPGSKNSGGDLGFQPTGVFAPEFQIRIDALKIGETSEPFHTQFGWHIAQVQQRRTRDTTEESRRAKVRGAIQQRKALEEYEDWLRRLRAEAYIEYRSATDANAAKS